MAPPDKPTEIPWRPDTSTNEAIKTAGENLSAPDAGRQEAGAKALETATEQVKKDPAFRDAIIASLNGTKISPEIRARLETLLAKINPEAALRRVTERTNKPSKATEWLLSPTEKDKPLKIDDTKLITSLVNKTPEEIQEQFKSLNKKDLKLMFESLGRITTTTKIEWVDQAKIDATKKAIETVMGMMLGKMIENGYIIDDATTDVPFLKEHGEPKIREFLGTPEATKALSVMPCVLKTNKWVPSITSAISEKDGIKKLTEGLDVSKLNVVDLEAMRKEAQKTAGSDNWRIVMERFRDAFGPLIWDNNILSKILKSLFSFLGINFDEKKGPEFGKEKPKKEALLAHLTAMLEKKDNKNMFSNALPEGKLPTWEAVKSPNFLSYLENVQFISNITEYSTTEKVNGKAMPIYWPETIKKVAQDQKMLIEKWYEPGRDDGVFDERTALAVQEFVSNNEQPKTKKAPETTEAINTGRMSLDLAKKIGEKATLEDIKKDRTLVKSIQDALGVEHKKWYGVYWPRTTKAMNEWYTNTLKLTGNVDPKQIKTLLEKPAAPKEAKK